MISFIVLLTALLPFVAQDIEQRKVELAPVDTIYVHIDNVIYQGPTGPIGVEVDTLLAIPWKTEGEK